MSIVENRQPQMLARSDVHTGIQVGAIHALIAAILVLRRPDGLFNSQFWAEDGAIFYASQVSMGFWKSIAIPYAGYLHAIPRLIAGMLQWVPVHWMPLAYNLCALIVSAFCCGFFSWPCFRRLMESDALRAATCIAATAAIPLGTELIMSICNLQSYLLLAAVLIIYRNSDRDPDHQTALGIEVSAAVLLTLICLTAPGALLFMPLLVVHFIRIRDWRRFTALAAITALAVQLYVIHHSNEVKPTWNFSTILLSVASSGVSRIVLAPLIGMKYLVSDSDNSLLVKLIVGFAAALTLMTVGLLFVKHLIDRRVILVAVYLGISSLALTMSGRDLGKSFISLVGIRYTQANRYFFLSSCMFIFLLIFILNQWFLRRLPGLAKFVVVLMLFSGGISKSFIVDPLVDLSWPTYASRIDAWRSAQARHEKVQPLVVPLNPPPLFRMTLNPRK